MCFSAIHWANIDRIVFGATIEDAKSLGFRELTISNHKMKSEGKSDVEIQARFMQEENQALFEEWNNNPDKKTY
jgi:tRNA(Arg) A34 adenosine deaminase TadA